MSLIEFDSKINSNLFIIKYKHVDDIIWNNLEIDLKTLHLLILNFGIDWICYNDYSSLLFGSANKTLLFPTIKLNYYGSEIHTYGKQNMSINTHKYMIQY